MCQVLLIITRICAESPSISEFYNNPLFVCYERYVYFGLYFKPEVICPWFTQFAGFMARTSTYIQTYTAAVECSLKLKIDSLFNTEDNFLILWVIRGRVDTKYAERQECSNL
jgi:hypothetical protein